MKNLTEVWTNLDTLGKVNLCLLLAMSIVQGFAYAPHIGGWSALMVVSYEFVVIYVLAAQLQGLIKIEKDYVAVPGIFATLILIADITLLWKFSWIVAFVAIFYLLIVVLKNDEIKIALNYAINVALEEKK